MIINSRFPVNIKMASEGGPGFTVEIFKSLSGAEQRNLIQTDAEHRYWPAKDVEDPDEIAALRRLFMAVRGPWIGFLFKDWEDYATTDSGDRNGSAVQSYIGIGDNSETEFQLSKRYSYGGISYDRPIYRPIEDTVRIFFNGTEQVSGWNISEITGIIYFDSPPGSGVLITALFEFDVPVRFVNERLPVGGKTHTVFYAKDLELIELKGPFVEEGS